jgi:peptide/nickel transport system permease protein
MKFLARRGLFYLFAAWAAVTVNFFLPRFMPGGPVEAALSRFQGQLSPSATRSLEIAFGINTHASLWSEYLSYWDNLFHARLGLSFTYFPTPVASVIAQSLPWTVILLTVATAIAWGIGTLVGIVTGWRQGTWLDGVLPAGAFLRGIPHFWIGLVTVAIAGVSLGWFPVSGGYAPGSPPGFTLAFAGSAIDHAILPAFTIIVGSLAGHMLTMRNMMVTTLAEDYVLAAEAKGLPGHRVMITYAARNAILPTVAGFALELGFVVSGALLVEKVYSYPGIGYVLFQAIHNDDYPLMQGILLITTFAVLIANLLADVAFFALDPRTRESRA